MLAKYYVITAIQLISTSFGICAGSCTCAGPSLPAAVGSFPLVRLSLPVRWSPLVHWSLLVSLSLPVRWSLHAYWPE